MKLKIKKLFPDALLPAIANPHDACIDVFSYDAVTLQPGQYEKIGTGIAIDIPKGYVVELRPRSGIALEHGVTILNTPATIDSGYPGQIFVLLINHGKEPFKVNKGMRIAQMLVSKLLDIEIEETSKIKNSHRNTDGWGSSGFS